MNQDSPLVFSRTLAERNNFISLELLTLPTQTKDT